MVNPVGVTPFTRSLLLAALIGLAWWFFGNLYEAVVISPNWVIDSPAQLTRMHDLFTVTSPTTYFVPAMPMTVTVLWVALYLGRRSLPSTLVRSTVAVSIALVALTIAIVTILVDGLFGADYLEHADVLVAYARCWNVANLIRMALTATCGVLTWCLLHTPARAA
ncbi:MAG TPA: hypothetical protein VIT41_16615 [Microlunatus sp.]